MKNQPWPIARVLLIGLGVFAVLLLAILVLQLHGLWLHSQFYTTTGGENHAVYGIWKVLEGHPLYAWPNRDFYPLTLYNFEFSHLYAATDRRRRVFVVATCLYSGTMTWAFGFIACKVSAWARACVSSRAVCEFSGFRDGAGLVFS